MAAEGVMVALICRRSGSATSDLLATGQTVVVP
jgi:hypothetical protein